MVAKRWRKIWLGMFLAPLGLALAGLPESRAQYWAFRKVLPPRQNDPEKIWLDRFLAAQQASSPQTPAPFNTPDNDFYMHSYSYRSYYPAGESGRPVSSPAGGPPYGIEAGALPWNQVDFKGYDEPPLTPRDPSLVEPRKYLLEAAPLTGRSPAEAPEVAVLIAYLPEHAVLVVDGRRTRSEGQTRYLQSPPLTPGKGYSYTVGVTWIEDGRWVSQTRKVPVRAGLIQAIYLRAAPALMAKKK
jgi:uncharacterized protein (TIGR03000 family)